MLVEIICYVVMVYGLCNILVYGSGPFDVLIKFKNWCEYHCSMIYNMLQCMMCTSTNIGWIFSLINILCFPMLHFTPATILFGDLKLWYLIIIFDAFLTSGSVWLIHTIQETFESITNYLKNHE